jgi:DNA-binding GntR family transcriptional regulator
MSEAVATNSGSINTGPVNAGSRASQVFERLQEAIVRGELAPGTKLREADLSAEYGISRGPLREALHRLEGRRLIQKIPNVGAQVVSLSLPEIREIFQIRENLESLACRLAAENMSDQELTELGQVLSHHQQHLDADNGRSYLMQHGDEDFHYRIIQGSGNRMLVNLLCDELYQLVRMIRYSTRHDTNRPAQALTEHQRIYEALKNRDGELAGLLMQRHIAGAQKILETRMAGSL